VVKAFFAATTLIAVGWVVFVKNSDAGRFSKPIK
jgi:hypothetical protein